MSTGIDRRPLRSVALETTARDVEPAVVEILTTACTAPDGYIVINAHVVRGAHRLRVELPELSGGRSILARR